MMKTNDEIIQVYSTNHENIIYACLTIDKLSFYIKKYNNTGIQKSVFYTLKWYFIKYLIDNCIYETEDIYTNSNVNVYRMKVLSMSYTDNLDVIYNIVFNLAGQLFSYNIKDNGIDYIKNRIPISEFIPVIDINIDNTSKLCLNENGVYVYYSDFITWCGNHNWFFVPYVTVSNILQSYDFLETVYKHAKLAIFVDPNAPFRKLMTRTYDVYIYMLEGEKFKYLKCSKETLPIYLNIPNHSYLYLDDSTVDPFKDDYNNLKKKYTLYKVNTETNEKTEVCTDYVKKRLIAKQNLLTHYNRYNNINNIIYELK